MKLKTLFLLVISASLLHAQEICDNAIDDDGDGLIDLFDEDCNCGAGLNAQELNAIANPGFDSSSCCPPQIWTNNNLNCVDDWSASNTNWGAWGLQYLNSCDTCGLYNFWWNTLLPPECSSPSANGFLGLIYWSNNVNWVNYNYASSCLNIPFTPNNTYTLDFDVFNNWWNANWGWYANDTLRLSLYGTTNCNNIPLSTPIGTSACSDPNWVVLDSIIPLVPTDSLWHNYTFNFQPSSTITGIAIGPSCDLTSPTGTFNYHRVFLDNLNLEYSHTYNLAIAESGGFCTNDYLLSATIDTIGGTWQWYQDSIALVGETNAILDITNFGAGDYTARYILSGRCQSLTITTIPAIYPFAFMANINNACEGVPIVFDGSSFISNANGNSITDYHWHFGEGGTSFQEDTTYSYPVSGTHTVNFVAISDEGCTDTSSQVVTIHPKPAANYTFTGDCIYDSIVFTDMSTIPTGFIDSIFWDFNNSNFGLDSIESQLYASTGNYNVELFVESDQGCVDSIILPVYISPKPVASFVGLDTCAQSLFGFTNTSTVPSGNILGNQWDFGDNSVSGLTTPFHIYNNEGTYDVKLIVTSDSGCVDTASLSLIAHPIPEASFDVLTTCYRGTFTNQSSISTGAIVSNDWNLGDNTLTTDFSPIHTYLANGSYNVSLMVTSDFGCTDDTIITTVINTTFAAGIDSDKDAVCSGQCINFSDASTAVIGIASYEWVFSDGQTSKQENPEICFSNLTDENEFISVFFKISTNTGCIDSAYYTNEIEVIPNPTAFFTHSPEEVPRSEPEVQFDNKSTLAASYDWNFGDGSNGMEINPFHVYPEIAKNYTITLTAYDASGACEDTYQSILIVKDEILFFIPSAFTMDGNGFNQDFKPVFYSGVDIYDFQLEIFNRWGEVLFVSQNPAVGWDGYYSQGQAKEGVYIWKVTFNETMSDKTHVHTGHVTLLK